MSSLLWMKYLELITFEMTLLKLNVTWKNFRRIGYGNIKDLILFYSKSKNLIWNELKQKYTAKDIEKLFPKINNQGRIYTTVPLHAPGETEFKGKSSKPFKGI